MEKEKDFLKDLINNDKNGLDFGFRVTMTVDFAIPKGYTHFTPEELAKEWFEQFPMGHSHAFRDGSKIGFSEVIKNVEIVKKQ